MIYAPKKAETINPYEPDAYFEMSGDRCVLQLRWKNITARDLASVSKGRASFGIWYSASNDLFFSYRFGDDAWADTVFSIMQLTIDKRIPPTPPRNSSFRRLNLQVELVNPDTESVRVRRTLPLSMGFSRKLATCVGRQYTKRYQGNWSPEAFYNRLVEVFNAYPSPMAIVSAQGCVTCQSE